MRLVDGLRRSHLAVFVGIALASTAVAQTPPMSAQPQQQFRDPKTGQIWTPQNVGRISGPNTPADRAFNPQAQTTVVKGTVVQTPGVSPVGTVPITAGPTVPIAIIDNATLSAIPAQRWQVVLYLNNNSANTINPVIDCRFTNGSNLVEETRANLPPVGGGQRVGLTIFGPQTTLFVDRADCRLTSPV